MRCSLSGTRLWSRYSRVTQGLWGSVTAIAPQPCRYSVAPGRWDSAPACQLQPDGEAVLGHQSAAGSDSRVPAVRIKADMPAYFQQHKFRTDDRGRQLKPFAQRVDAKRSVPYQIGQDTDGRLSLFWRRTVRRGAGRCGLWPAAPRLVPACCGWYGLAARG